MCTDGQHFQMLASLLDLTRQLHLTCAVSPVICAALYTADRQAGQTLFTEADGAIKQCSHGGQPASQFLHCC